MRSISSQVIGTVQHIIRDSHFVLPPAHLIWVPPQDFTAKVRNHPSYDYSYQVAFFHRGSRTMQKVPYLNNKKKSLACGECDHLGRGELPAGGTTWQMWRAACVLAPPTWQLSSAGCRSDTSNH